MHRVKRLIREMHRRSLWQILTIFLAASWGVVQFVDFLTFRAGLPDWTPSMALVLLLVGLPFVLATAFVQEGMPGRDGKDPAPDPVAPQAPRAPQAPQAPPPEPSGIRRLFTWRKAALGGMGAFALLGLSIAAYFLMWATGIGPAGNLVAQGVIERGDRVILATFFDETGEGLGDVVTEALRVDLAQASILALVETVDIAPVLARMQVEPGAIVTGDLAREVAVREGIGAVIEGRVARAGTGYLITATFVEASSGRSLAAFRATAQGPDGIIGSMDRLSHDIREKSGESLRSVRAGEPLEKATTRSLEALRLFTDANRAFSRADYGQALAFLEQAVTIDPAFAMAWRRMAVVLASVGTDPVRQEHAATQAYIHRDRLTEHERLLAEAYYHGSVQRDRAREVAAYQNVLRIAPDDRAALNNLANVHTAIHDFGRAEELLRRAVGGPGRTNSAYQNLIRVLMATGNVAAAEAVLREFEAAYPGDPNAPEWAFWVAFMKGDHATARAVTLPRLDDPGLPAFMRVGAHAQMSVLAYREGKLEEGREYMLAAERVASETGPALQFRHRQFTVHIEGLLGDRDWALRHARTVLDGHSVPAFGPDPFHWFMLASNLAVLGDRERAEHVIAAWEADLDRRGAHRLDRIEIDRARVLADVAAGRVEGRLEALRDLAAEAGCPSCWIESRAWVAARSGHTPEAIRLYEEMLRRGFDVHWFIGTHGTDAVLRLGPLYEQVGDTARAVSAYRRVVDLWSGGDARGMERVRAAEARIAALEGSAGG